MTPLEHTHHHLDESTSLEAFATDRCRPGFAANSVPFYISPLRYLPTANPVFKRASQQVAAPSPGFAPQYAFGVMARAGVAIILVLQQNLMLQQN